MPFGFLKFNIGLTIAIMFAYNILIFQQILGHYNIGEAQIKLNKLNPK